MYRMLFILQVPEFPDSPFTLSAMSEKQQKFLDSLISTSDLLLHVEGPHRLWLQKIPIFYYSLRVSDQSNSQEEGKCS